MKIEIKHPCRQVYWAVFALFFIFSCNGKKEETPILLPLTSPLSQSYIGFGVINVSYTRVTALPGKENSDESSSPGYLRRGSVVHILKRQMIKSQEKPESWVLVEGSCTGWLKETLVDIYNSEAQANTASAAMGEN